ncbi:hydrolase [Methylopila jiangsuensis]|uniref:Hydrolase n=1 Tax=Methylopila jiangsuensis TaxID=586230 RepID=A0A9W6JIS8_9HYPH|nr:alpha/beta hydrolase [Methylopila jiangsuensis]MDR6287108.1 phospholipase/carboxylesterase [Methylopila jiangsuensis]GLK76595.1 hydrolase [Methylopila jiangsuensis]
MTARDLSFAHVFRPAARPGPPPVLLLHGTGGDETDLLPLGEAVAPGAALLSPRGQVLERGAPRFFRRLAEGVFDEDDVRRRAGDLARFIAEARETYGIGAPVALGYSNGANIAAAVLLLHPESLAGAALLRPMAVLSDPPQANLRGKPVLMLSGAADPIAGPDSVAALEVALTASGAEVTREILLASHGLTRDDLAAATAWFARRAADAPSSS